MPYVPLHVHSINSPQRGMMTPAEIVARAAHLKLPAVALTDAWNTYGHVEFFGAARRAGIRPVLGAEVRHLSLTGHRGAYHLTLLARSGAGYRNLVRLVGLHHRTEQNPHVTPEELAGHSDGLIVLTGCMRGEANQAVRHGNLGRERQVVERLLEIYGAENVFLEVMTHGTQWEQFVLDKMVLLSKHIGVPLVVTNNDRFIAREDAAYFEVFRGLDPDAGAARDENERSPGEYYLKHGPDLEPLFYFIAEALERAGEIAARCDVSLAPAGAIVFSPDPDADGTLAKMCERRFVLEFHADAREEKRLRHERLRVELERLRAQGLSGLILFMDALLRACRADGMWIEVVGGPLPESIAAYLLGIAPLDPVAHGLVFESLGAPERGVPPPVELLRSKGSRERFIELLGGALPGYRFQYHYQREESSMATLVRELAVTLDLGDESRDGILEALARMRGRQNLAALLEGSERLAHICNTDQAARKTLYAAHALQGRVSRFVRNSSRIVILPPGTENFVALVPGAGGEEYVMSDGDGIAALGGWVLVVQQSHFLSALAGAVGAVAARQAQGAPPGASTREHAGAWRPDTFDDAATFAMIRKGDTTGVYLLESRGIRGLLASIKPAGFDELVNVISLYRPAPLEGKLDQRYIDNAEKKGRVLLPHHSLAVSLEATRGLLLYREQVREIMRHCAGLAGERAAKVLSALLHRDPAELAAARLIFIRGAMDNDVNEEEAQKVFDFLLHNIEYTYDKAFGCTQAYISYRSAWLKAHYPAEYFAGLLEAAGDARDRRERYLEHLAAGAPQVVPPDINRGGAAYEARGGTIVAPLTAACDLTPEELSRILGERERGGLFASLNDFLRRLVGELPMETVRGMADCGLFDSLGSGREKMQGQVLEFYERHAKAGDFFRPPADAGRDGKRRRDDGQLSFLDQLEE